MRLTTLAKWPYIIFGHSVMKQANSCDIMYAHYSIAWAHVYVEFRATLPV